MAVVFAEREDVSSFGKAYVPLLSSINIDAAKELQFGLTVPVSSPTFIPR